MSVGLPIHSGRRFVEQRARHADVQRGAHPGDGGERVHAGDPVLTAPVSVAAGDKLYLIIKEFVPANAPFNAQDQITITASFNHLNASPPRERPAGSDV